MFTDQIKHRVAWRALRSPEATETVPGELLTMGDGSQWFHPYSGGAPTRVQPPTMDAAEAENIYLSAVNEGDIYEALRAMGEGASNLPDSAWVQFTRDYTRRLLRERRIAGWPSAQTINGAAMALRDRFIEHAAELRRLRAL